jgi:amidohydrolase
MTDMLDQARAIQDRLVQLRRTIHQHPELSFQEIQTARLVAETLRSLGLRVQTGVARTGVVGYLGQGRPCIAIRADMDALPITELNEVPYRSQVAGLMHACGHDTHVAMALGAAMLLAGRELPGQVRFLFQPSEEKCDEQGVSGAARMIQGGALEGVDAVIAQHVDPGTASGSICISPGPIGATEDTFQAAIRGRGCHGATPDVGLDPVYLTSQVLPAIYGITSRFIDPIKPALVSVGVLQAGTESNIIPEEVHLAGTIRSFDDSVRQELHRHLRRAFDVVKAFGGDYDLRIEEVCLSQVNDAAISDFIRQVAVDLLGEEHVLPADPGMGAEDFGYMTRTVPGAMFGLGTQKGECRPVHSPRFDIEEEALAVGAALLAEVAVRFLISPLSRGAATPAPPAGASER